MICFLNFHETLSLARATSGDIFIYGENEISELIPKLRRRERIRAVIFETELRLDPWHMVRTCAVSVLMPSSLEEMYRMLITAATPVVIYICRELMRRRESFEIAGYVSGREPRMVPEDINAAVASGDIDYALSLYQDMEEAAERAGISKRENAKRTRGSRDGGYGRMRLMRIRKTEKAQVFVFVSGHLRPMVQYLLADSDGIDVAYIAGFYAKIHQNLLEMSAGHKYIIWISATYTACADVLPDLPEGRVRHINVRSMHELYESLSKNLPKELRKLLRYPGRPVEWPSRHLPAVSGPEQRMCPGCIHRRADTSAAYCLKLGIDVFRNPGRIYSTEEEDGHTADTGRGRRVIIGRSDGERVQRHGYRYAIRTFACSQCGICITDFGCPAISRDGLHYHIDPYLCSGCGDCVGVCPEQAIYSFGSESGLS